MLAAAHFRSLAEEELPFPVFGRFWVLDACVGNLVGYRFFSGDIALIAMQECFCMGRASSFLYDFGAHTLQGAASSLVLRMASGFLFGSLMRIDFVHRMMIVIPMSFLTTFGIYRRHSVYIDEGTLFWGHGSLF